jgi:preprotein translocase subunit Sss1
MLVFTYYAVVLGVGLLMLGVLGYMDKHWKE